MEINENNYTNFMLIFLSCVFFLGQTCCCCCCFFANFVSRHYNNWRQLSWAIEIEYKWTMLTICDQEKKGTVEKGNWKCEIVLLTKPFIITCTICIHCFAYYCYYYYFALISFMRGTYNKCFANTNCLHLCQSKYLCEM